MQELCDKKEELPTDIRWHMIGHLQRNKVKHIIKDVALIHSVDTYRLAEEINVHAKKVQRTMPILIEVNIAGESSKFGILEDEALQLYVEDPEENRPYFKKLKNLSVDIARENIDNVSMDVLSMGMTGDYVTAIEEGATIVRVGTGIFGKRK